MPKQSFFASQNAHFMAQYIVKTQKRLIWEPPASPKLVPSIWAFEIKLLIPPTIGDFPIWGTLNSAVRNSYAKASLALAIEIVTKTIIKLRSAAENNRGIAPPQIPIRK